MPSIGLLLVVMSIGLPHRRHIAVIGDPGAARTGPSGGGAGGPRGPPSMPPPARRHIARTPTGSRMTRSESATAQAGEPPPARGPDGAEGPTLATPKPPAAPFEPL